MLRGLGKNAYILPGSPVTLLVKSSDGYYVIDPGSEIDRRGEIETQGKVRAVLLTHSHSDHVLAAVGLKSELGTFAPLHETPFIESPELREATTFGGYAPWDLIFHVEAAPVQVDHPFRLPFRIDEIEAVALPGHTFGQVGYLTDSGILYAADSFFGDKLLKSVVVPYFLDYETALKTLEWLRDRARDFEKLVPSHGPIVEGRRAVELLDFNITTLESLREKVISELKQERGVEELAARILLSGGAEPTTSSIILSSVTLRSLLSRLYERGLVEVRPSDRGLLWKLSE